MIIPKENINQIITIIDQRSLRERILFFASCLSVIYFLWQNIFVDSIILAKQELKEKASKIQLQISNLQGQISDVSSLDLDPIIKLQEKIKETEEENDALEEKLTVMTEKLIPPKEMTIFLKNILDRHKNLIVVKVENITTEPVFGSKGDNEKLFKESASKDKEALSRFQVYKHGLEIVVNGTFMQIRDFLEEAEQLPWKVLWEELEFAVIKYPVATTRIVIKTLSVNSNLLSTS